MKNAMNSIIDAIKEVPRDIWTAICLIWRGAVWYCRWCIKIDKENDCLDLEDRW